LRSSAKHVDAFIALSGSVREICEHSLPGLPISELPPFLPSADPENESRDDELPVIPSRFFVFVGRLERLKGLHTLFPVFHDLDVPLLVAGTGTYERTLHAKAGDQNIQFLGHRSPHTIRHLLRKALALIVPSICQEISPLVVLEAFREGTPVIARNLGGLPELVHSSGGGYTYTADSDLREILRCFLREPDLRPRLGTIARQAFERNWTAEAHMNRYEELIEHLSSGHHSGPS